MAFKGGSPGLVVMGGDSCSEGCGFESQHCILDVLMVWPLQSLLQEWVTSTQNFKRIGSYNYTFAYWWVTYAKPPYARTSLSKDPINCSFPTKSKMS